MIDNNEYDDAELVELKVPLNNPYQQRFTQFERYYGQITIEGKTYHYVKRKIEGDVLILKCLPNNSTDVLRDIASGITASNSNNKQGDTPAKSSVKIFSPEYGQTISSFVIHNQAPVRGSYVQYSDPLSDALLAIPHQPPREAGLS